MSTFSGTIREFPLISVDEFTEHNHSSTMFFLSHCHKDHMNGLKNEDFFKILENRNFSKIYTSKISRILLLNDRDYKRLSKYIEVIDIENPTTLVVKDGEGKKKYSMLVTLLPAGHCPGSVMFLFETEKANVLYTGDFRLEEGQTAQMKHLHYENGRVKPITSVYLDTTFCDPASLYIPSRTQCLDAIDNLVHSWVTLSPNHIIFLSCPANFGYEYIFNHLYETFGYKIHITQKKYRQYREIEEIINAVTIDANETQIHSCWMPFCNRITDGLPAQIRKIKLSAMFYTMNVNVNDIVLQVEPQEEQSFIVPDQDFKVCFSTHSSLAEIGDMISHLQPQNIYANVVPEKKTEVEVLKWVLPLLKHRHFTEPEFQIPVLGDLLATSNGESLSPSCGSLDFNDVVNVNVNASLFYYINKNGMARNSECEQPVKIDSEKHKNIDRCKENDTKLDEFSKNCVEQSNNKVADAPTWNYSPHSESDSTTSLTPLSSDVVISSPDELSQEEENDSSSLEEEKCHNKQNIPRLLNQIKSNDTGIVSNVVNTHHVSLCEPFEKKASSQCSSLNLEEDKELIWDWSKSLPLSNSSTSSQESLSLLVPSVQDSKIEEDLENVIENHKVSSGDETDLEGSPSLISYSLNQSRIKKRCNLFNGFTKEREVLCIDLCDSDEDFVISSSEWNAYNYMSRAKSSIHNSVKKAKICDN